jgi:hypothetical protein
VLLVVPGQDRISRSGVGDGRINRQNLHAPFNTGLAVSLEARRKLFFARGIVTRMGRDARPVERSEIEPDPKGVPQWHADDVLRIKFASVMFGDNAGRDRTGTRPAAAAC